MLKSTVDITTEGVENYIKHKTAEFSSAAL